MISTSVAIGPSFERPDHFDSNLPSPTSRWIGTIEAAHSAVRFAVRATSTAQADGIGGRAKRQREFLAGRRCAAQLLSERGVYHPVGVNKDRSPAWPEGIVGSISHSERWTIACIAAEGAIRSIGVDTEPVMSADTRKLIGRDVASDNECQLLHDLDLDKESALTLIFSAKETFYKCWSPINKRFLEFLDVEVFDATASTLRLRRKDGHAAEESTLVVDYCLSDADVFTFASLERDQ